MPPCLSYLEASGEGMVEHWWLDEAPGIAKKKLNPACKEKLFAKRARQIQELEKKMKRQKLWWSDKHDRLDIVCSNHTVKVEQAGTEEGLNQVSPQDTGSVLEASQSREHTCCGYHPDEKCGAEL